MFASDRDLLAHEPNLFRDVMWVGQRVISGTGSVSGTTLTVTGVDLLAAGVGAGWVAVYDATPVEVLAVLTATTATVSLLRAEASGPAIPPAALGSKPVVIGSFRPQLALVHGQVLRMLGIEPGAAAAPGVVTEESITNPESLRLVEALGALHLVYSAAAALSGADSPMAERAEIYKQRFAEERRLAAARIDLDGDGIADATRRLNIVRLVRG